MSKEILHGDKSRDAILQGVNILSDAVKVTLGPRGRNVVIEKPFGAPTITKDGVTVAREIELKDPVQNIGAQMLRQVALKTSDVAGDGTTTATVLAQSIFSDGLAMVKSGANPMALKRGIDKAVAAIVGERVRRGDGGYSASYNGGILNSISIPVTDEMIPKIGTISANGDEQIGLMIADAVKRVGKEGVVAVEESQTMDNELVVVEGMCFERGYISPYFITDPQKMSSTLNDAWVLVSAKPLTAVDEVKSIADRCAAKQKQFFIIAPDVSGMALQALALNHVHGRIRACAIKAPGFGPQQIEVLHDIAAITGAKVVTDESGIRLSKITDDVFGSATTITVTTDTTTIIGGCGTRESVEGRASIIRSLIDNCKAEFELNKLRERLAKLVGGVAVIKVGAPTELEMKEKKDRVEDAVHATRAAIAEGIVPGGGVALIRCSKSLSSLSGFTDTLNDEDERQGAYLVSKSLSVPLAQIAFNCGMDGLNVCKQVSLSADNPNYGYDALTGLYCDDMVAAGIIDPTKVTRNALINAASIAGMMLTTEAMITVVPEEVTPTSQRPMPGM